MKKLFLTSGIIACMACPAFAEISTTNGAGFPATNGAVADNGVGDCVQPTIGAFSGSTTLTAKWIANEYEIDLDETSGVANSSNPDTLYTRYASGAYLDSNRTSLMSTAANGLTSIPTGATVNVIYSSAIPANPVTQDTYIVSNEPQNTSATRTFTGYYAASTGGSPLIDSTGKITADGTAAAAGYTSNQTWYAQWNCTNQNVPAALSLDGYDFGGWFVDIGTGSDTRLTPGGTFCPMDDTQVYATWTARDYTVTYNCGTGATRDNAPESQTATFDMPFTFQGNTEASQCAKQGYHFTGWSCDNGVGSHATTVSDGVATGDAVAYWQYASTLPNNSTITCTAQYVANDISITWSQTDATTPAVLPEGSNTCTYGGDVTMPSTNPERTGYTFDGWEVTSTSAAAGLD